MKLTITVVIALCVGHVMPLGLMQGFLDFADLQDSGTGNNTTGDEGWPADFPFNDFPPFEETGPPTNIDPIPPAGGVPDNTQVLPPDPDFPQDPGFPFTGAIPLPGDVGTSGDPSSNTPGQSNPASGTGAADAGWPAEFPFNPNEFPPFDPTTNGMDTGTDPFALDNSGIISQNDMFPPLEETPRDNTGGRPLDVAHFLPSIPINSKVMELNNGNVGIFNPNVNFIGDNPPTDFPTEPTTTTTTKAPTTRPPTTRPPTTKPSTKPPPTKPIVIKGGIINDQGMNKPTIEVGPVPVGDIPFADLPVGLPAVPGDGVGVQPGSVNDVGGFGNVMPIKTDVIPLGPAIGMDMDLSPPKRKGPKRGKGNKKGVPDEWMVLYPNGRPPRRNTVVPNVDSVIPTLNTDEFWRAQNTLNSFSRDRAASLTYRKQRRDKAKQQRKMMQEQRRQNRNNKRNNRGPPPPRAPQQQQQLQRGGKGPKGAQVAKMTLPNSRKPFVGKNQRGRSSRRPCTRQRRRRGLCGT